MSMSFLLGSVVAVGSLVSILSDWIPKWLLLAGQPSVCIALITCLDAAAILLESATGVLVAEEGTALCKWHLSLVPTRRYHQ